MNEASKVGADWLTSQMALWPAWSSAAPRQAGDEGSLGRAAPLDERFDDLRDTWLASAAKWSEFVREASRVDLRSADKLREMFTPASWAAYGSDFLDTALRRVLEGPRYAVLWDLDRKLLELLQLTLRRDKDIAAYQTVMQKAWNAAFERFAGAVASASEPVAKRTWRSLVDQWLTVANDTLTEVYRSEEFLDVQRRTLRSATDRSLQERLIAEAWCEATHVPTRSEVDELQHEVVELRRELRLLRRAARADADRVAGSRPRRKSPAKRARA